VRRRLGTATFCAALLVTGACSRSMHSSSGEAASTQSGGARGAPESQVFREAVSKSIFSLVNDDAAKVPFCQATALNAHEVLFPKHCAVPNVRLLAPDPQRLFSFQSISVDAAMDLALAATAEPLPASHFPTLQHACPQREQVRSACAWSPALRRTGLRRESFTLVCNALSCSSTAVKLPAGASGCPVFGAESSLVAMGFGWSRRGSHFVCVTRDVVDSLRQNLRAPVP